jgi:molybdopterin-guanine dinucleotide biosynthesis protein A
VGRDARLLRVPVQQPPVPVPQDSPDSQRAQVGVVIISGGRSSRMGRDKLSLRRHGMTLLDIVITQTVSTLDDPSVPVVIVGPQPSSTARQASAHRVRFTLEDPPGSGPLAGVDAGLRALREMDPGEYVIVLAGDAPAGPDAIASLLQEIHPHRARSPEEPEVDAVVVADEAGRRQPLCAIYRTAAVQSALQVIGDPTDQPMSRLLDALRVRSIPDTWGACDDVDTPQDAQRLGFDLG